MAKQKSENIITGFLPNLSAIGPANIQLTEADNKVTLTINSR